MMAIIGEIACLTLAVALLFAGIFGAWIGCALDSSGGKSSLGMLVFALAGAFLGWIAIHYGPITIIMSVTP